MDKKFYITTAIDYVNARPHLGHALEKIQADVLARWHRARGARVFFLSGTDENSLKNVQAAQTAGLPVKEFVDQNAEIFRSLGPLLDLSYDDFIRTTQARHVSGAKKLWQECQKDIYKKAYRGLYCVGCEEYYKEDELENGVCPEHKKKPEIVEEENYFFRLSVYQDQILKLIKNDTVKIIPEGRKNEILSFVKSGLEDICVSRSKERAKGWGIEVPGDENQVMWVWFDALSNYISALGYGGPENELFQEWWQNSQKIHMVGKGIIRFHAVHWIGLLLSAGLPVPNEIFVHGYVTSSGQKMSKSLGNVVDPFDLVAKYGTDPVRYFLLRELASTEDGDFTVARLEERYNADLAKGLGNLAARVTTIAKKINATANKDCANAELKQEIGNAISGRGEALGQYRFNDALAAIWKLVNHCDRYIEQTQPWKTNDAAAVGDLLFALSVIADLIEPFIPATSQKIKALLSGQEVGILFPRFDK